MDLNKLSTGDKVLAGSGIVLFIASFLTWFEYDAGFPSVSESGWDYFFTGVLPTLIGLALVGYVVATKLFDVKLPELPVPEPLVVLGLAAFAALLIIIRLLMGGDDEGTDLLERSYGLFIATIAVLGLAAGAFLKFQEDGGEFPTKGGSTGAGPGNNAPPSPF